MPAPISVTSSTESLGSLQTEQRNPRSESIDKVSSLELCKIINDEDASVSKAVRACLPDIADAIDAVVPRIKSGGRVIYMGAGTSGRLGVLDASEIPPTFSAPPEQFVGLIAGGDYAIRHAVEGAEDSEKAGEADLNILEPPIGPNDVVVGIASSGRTPYVLGGLTYAREAKAVTVGLACVKPSLLDGLCDILIECVTGPEIVTGSTRLKAGTATKMVLNMISTGAQIRAGKTYGNLMVDLRMSNEKLRDRARRVIRAAVPASASVDITDDDALDKVLAQCDGRVKLGILITIIGCSPSEGELILDAAQGSLRMALELQHTMASAAEVRSDSSISA